MPCRGSQCPNEGNHSETTRVFERCETILLRRPVGWPHGRQVGGTAHVALKRVSESDGEGRKRTIMGIGGLHRLSSQGAMVCKNPQPHHWDRIGARGGPCESAGLLVDRLRLSLLVNFSGFSGICV
jgi:hypothetical protein